MVGNSVKINQDFLGKNLEQKKKKIFCKYSLEGWTKNSSKNHEIYQKQGKKTQFKTENVASKS